MPKKIVHLIAAARPNFMKVAPLWHALSTTAGFEPVLIHTGQHYDSNMSDDILRDLNLPTPDHQLGVGSGSHAEQTAAVMVAYEKVALAQRPDWLIVVGDVNSTVAGAIVGAKLGIKVVHLEAGLRSRDRAMPEEINRLITDAIADVLWTPSPDGDENLLSEGIPAERITRVGNIMLDSFELVRPQIEAASLMDKLGLQRGGYGVVTLHRPSNVDEASKLAELVDSLVTVQRKLPLVFAVHPRTAARLAEFGLRDRLESSGIRLIDPVPYVAFMSLVMDCAVAITDSGGIQEETTYLGIPCLTLRENTERPITIDEGTNRLVRASSLASHVDKALVGRIARKRPELWDGEAAQRCVDDLIRRDRPGSAVSTLAKRAA